MEKITILNNELMLEFTHCSFFVNKNISLKVNIELIEIAILLGINKHTFTHSFSFGILTLVAWWTGDDKAKEGNALWLCCHGDCLC